MRALIVFLLAFQINAFAFAGAAQTLGSGSTTPSTSPKLSLESKISTLSVKEIENLRSILIGRLEKLNEFRLINEGLAPSRDSTVRFNSAQITSSFLSAIPEYESASMECSHFQKTLSGLTAALKKTAKKLASNDGDVVLAARLITLHVAFEGLMQLADANAEGGVELLTQEPIACEFSNSNEYKLALSQARIALVNARNTLVGFEGLRNSHEMSVALAFHAEAAYRSQLVWLFPKLIVGGAIGLVAPELLAVRIASALKPIAPALTAAKATRLLQAAIAIPAGAMAGQKLASGMADQKLQALEAGAWEKQLRFAETATKLNDKTGESYYDIITQIEDARSAAFLKRRRELAPILNPVVDRYGSLQKTQEHFQSQLQTVEKSLRISLN